MYDDPYYSLEPDPEVVENPAFLVELNRRLEEAALYLSTETIPLEEYYAEVCKPVN